ncbi:hypothetical protein FNV43_RR13321 [Rhamnella rubrinervis]|uniref:Dirigent protein n=1 Tax=Rhamnella rubrinervis TaxID=2594499 RepID=A0A8K0MF13_9ROSA|nr:hypothetical protein FNV43_RR13321 [Rhamnella rubrinervis]
MAENALARIAIISSFIIFVALAVTSSDASEAATKYHFENLKQTNFVFYMHDLATGRNNLTVNAVAGVPHKRWWILEFGTVFVCDDKLTEEYGWDSTEVGRAQGLYVNSQVDAKSVHLLVSLVFTNKEFNGSTLEIQGADKFTKYREVSVVSGTGKFRLARGFATLETVNLDIPLLYAIVRWNVTVFHY